MSVYRGRVVSMAWFAALLVPGFVGSTLLLAPGERKPLIAVALWSLVVCSALGVSLMLSCRLRGDLTYGTGVSIARWAANSFLVAFLVSLSGLAIALFL